MSVLVADTSALVSLGTTADGSPDPLSLCLDAYDVFLPTEVVDELRETASYADEHGRGAAAVLKRIEAAERTDFGEQTDDGEQTDNTVQTGDVTVRSVTLDAEFPLDDGENAAVTLANDVDAAVFLCDEFGHLGLIHASLADTRLVTTPTLLSVFVRSDRLTPEAAERILEAISAARSWDANSYVKRARSLLDDA